MEVDQMKSNMFAALLCVVSISGCSEKEKDFDLVCDYFNQLEIQLNQKVMTPSEKGNFILEKVMNNLSQESDAAIAWNAIAAAEPSERYNLFVSAAESSGIMNFRCPAMENLASTLE